MLNVVRCCLASAHYVIHRHESHAVAWYRGQRERHGEAPVALAALVAASRVQRGMEGRRAHARCCDAPLGDRRWVGAHPDRDAAVRTQARATAVALWSNPIERSTLVRLVRVVSVDSATGGDSARGCGGMSARVRAYTFFAIPYSEVRTVCDKGIVEYRVFRRRQ